MQRVFVGYDFPKPRIGLEGEPLRIKQIYHCNNTDHHGAACPLFRKRVESWVTPTDAKRLIDPLGLRCGVCHRPLKWISSEPLFNNPFHKRGE